MHIVGVGGRTWSAERNRTGPRPLALAKAYQPDGKSRPGFCFAHCTQLVITLLESKTGNQRRSHHCGSCTVIGRWLVLNATYTPPAALRWLRRASGSVTSRYAPVRGWESAQLHITSETQD